MYFQIIMSLDSNCFRYGVKMRRMGLQIELIPITMIYKGHVGWLKAQQGRKAFTAVTFKFYAKLIEVIKARWKSRNSTFLEY